MTKLTETDEADFETIIELLWKRPRLQKEVALWLKEGHDK